MTAAQLAPTAKDSSTRGCLAASLLSLLVGAGFLGLFATRAWRDVRIFTVWERTTCTIVSTDIASSRPSKGRSSYRPEITFRYRVGRDAYQCTGWDSWALAGDYGGGSYADYQRVLDRYEIGDSYPCWYDPADPSRAVLVRRVRPLYVLAVLPLALVVLGALGIWGTIPPRSRRVPAAAAPDVPDQASKPLWDYQRLPVRLEPDSEPAGQSCGAALLAAALLFVGAIASYAAWSEWQDGKAPIFVGLFVVVFGGLGLLFLYIAAAAALASRVPRTILEVERREIAPGESARAVVVQPGPARLRSVAVKMVCEELTPAKSGSPDVNVLHDEEIAWFGPLAAGRGAPFEATFDVRIPPGAPPSSGNTAPAVRWRLQLWGVPLVWPRFMLSFPIQVSGGRAGEAAAPTDEDEGR